MATNLLERLKREVTQLTTSEQIELAEYLDELASPIDAIESEEEFEAELHRRVEEMRRDPSAGIPWEQVLAELKAKFK